jgi:branched-chain amino acid transport system substrate-binding protein
MALAGAMLTGLLCSVPAAAEVLVAAAAPMTGPRAWSGEQSRRGAELAVADLNAAGGVLGQRVRLILGDDAADAEQAVAVAHKLVADGVKFVSGHRSSDASLAALPIYAQAGVIQISPSSTNPRLTEQKVASVFRVCGRDDQQGTIAADFLARRWPDAAVGIVHDESAYGTGLAEQTKRRLNQLGKPEALFARYWSGTRDFTPLLDQLRVRNISVLYIGGYSTEAGLITRQAREAGNPLQIISGDALHNSDYWMITGDTGTDALFTFDLDPRQRPVARTVVEKFRADGYEPEGYTLHTYATLQVWAQAVEKAGTFATDAVVKALHEGEFQTVMGPLEFDAKGDMKRHSFVWYRWRDGSYFREP